MKELPLPTSDMTVAEILEQWPEAILVFQENKTACVGCVMAPFDTVRDVATIYGLECDQLLEALRLAAVAAHTDGRFPVASPAAPEGD